jgi:hypothetical protein
MMAPNRQPDAFYKVAIRLLLKVPLPIAFAK